MKKALFIFFLYISIQSYSQNYTPEKLDSITSIYKNKGEYKKVFQYNIAALQYYKKHDNPEGEALANINIANALSTFDEHQKSLHYLEEAKEQLKLVNNNGLNARLCNEIARNYAFLGLYNQANIQLNKSIEYLKHAPDTKENRNSLFFVYIWKWSNFEDLKLPDSINAMREKGLKDFPNEPKIYVRIAEQFLSRKQHLDSVEYYLNKASVLAVENSSSLHAYGAIATRRGNLYTLKKDYPKALEYYQESLPIYLKINRGADIIDTYKKIYQTYLALHDIPKANEYLVKYTQLNDSIQSGERKAVASVVNNLAIEQEKERNNLYIIIVAIAGIAIVSIAAIFMIRKRNKKRDQLLEEQKKLIGEKIIETDQLKKKVDTSINELSKMATSNNPFFISKFKEVYPEFHKKLTSNYPELTNHDIKFIAYVRLNLTNKEIGQCGNVTVRAVETKKYRLKKKLELPADMDLGTWVLGL
ncbi:tetratricopeptide repeat protein [Chryseobacterium viscerum]|uniref:Tetratricopeptide repeat protein n=1 Tax=Chryseobacterium viscerum TaxID=1037377 RepID=A0A316WKS2_9FLAO|nr:tetratricopeptide repeat protein [Chryseobacterium viscerum]KAB1232767.1 tetratricopeptide repeat protein [Chryseobacterium viscerum]PWN61063.1 tetratricopeptide repeat protein [Chryseobacterium viscerum]